MAIAAGVVVLALLVVVVGAMVWQLLRLDELVNKVAEIAATLANIQIDARTVASALATAQVAVDGVAVDLAASHVRADSIVGHPGEASDAAARSADG